jgi:lipopolysaccharide biosynthesis protein
VSVRVATRGDGAATDDLRYLAFYLPQFHPIPENDQWWGEGFTEWTNVVRAVPSFPGHHQPHAPERALGYYDLRDPGIRTLQAKLARDHGIDGFIYYHYWFAGRRLLEQPFNEVLASGEPDFPFCLCWANESWTRTWDGLGSTVLVAQTYGDEDDRAHIRWLGGAFADRRYIRVGGRPLFLVYLASSLPDPRRTTDIWRDEARRAGLGELYLCRVEAVGDRGDPTALGFDASVEFQPDWLRSGPRLSTATDGIEPTVYSYPVTAELARTNGPTPYKRYRCVMPGWDNSPRRGRAATVFAGSAPERYQRWLASVRDEFRPYSPDENLVFVNAWNEWGEGNHMEPDERWGRAYLEAHAKAAGRWKR